MTVYLLLAHPVFERLNLHHIYSDDTENRVLRPYITDVVTSHIAMFLNPPLTFLCRSGETIQST
jgi:hypothetical protein